MPQPAENLTYESVVDAANPAYPWTPPMANAAVPAGAGVLAYQPRLHPPDGAAVAYPVPGSPTDPYPSGGGTALVSVALNAAGSWPGRIDFKVTTGPSAVAIAAYLGAPGVTLDKAAMPRYRCTVPPSATDAVVTVGDATRVNLALQLASLGRQWSKAGAQYIHADGNLDNRCMTSDDGINWHGKTTPTDASVQTWEGIDYSPELGRLCAVSNAGGTPTTARVMTSDDGGDTWTVRTAASVSAWRDVAWGGPVGDKRFVGVASTSAATNIMTSPDGVNWTSRTKPNTNQLRSVCWAQELNLWVAVGDTGTGNRAFTSADGGMTWVAQTTPADNAWFNLAWSPQLRLLVAVANSGTAGNGGRVMTSPDGINWTQQPLDAGTNGLAWTSVCWSPVLMMFVAVAGGGASTERIMTSPDGINWTSRTAANVLYQSVCWAPGLNMFVGVLSSGGSSRAIYSLNGVNWFGAYNMPAANTWFSVCWAGAPFNRLVAVATANGINPELVTWKGLDLRNGDRLRWGFNLISGQAGRIVSDPTRNTGSLLSTLGFNRGTTIMGADYNAFGFYTNTDVAAQFDDATFYKETPTSLPQGLYDVHVCHADAAGVEGAVTKFSNVNVV